MIQVLREIKEVKKDMKGFLVLEFTGFLLKLPAVCLEKENFPFISS